MNKEQVTNFWKQHWQDITAGALLLVSGVMFYLGSEPIDACFDLIKGEEVVGVQNFENCPWHFLLSDYSNEQTDPSVNRVNVSEDGVINLGIEDDVEDRYVNYLNKAVNYYNDVFKVINPNIKLECHKGVNIEDEVRVFREPKDTEGIIMSVWSAYNTSALGRLNDQMEFKVYPKADRQTNDHIQITCLHELGHVLGLNDHNDKHFDNSSAGETGCDDFTIMNYSDITALTVFNKYGISLSDYSALVKIYGPNSDEEANEFGYEDLEDYYKVVNSNIENFCVTSAFDKNGYEME